MPHMKQKITFFSGSILILNISNVCLTKSMLNMIAIVASSIQQRQPLLAQMIGQLQVDVLP